MCIVCGMSLNVERKDAFAGQLLDILNHGAMTLMISVGHRTGLFDAMADGEAVDSEGLADKAGLNERYVREWLRALAVGRIVEHDPVLGTYRLPAEHAHWLGRKSPESNMAIFAQYIAELGSVESRIVESFRHGGGVAYGEYGRFHDIMAEDSGQSIVPMIDSSVVDLVPGLRERLEKGIDVVDVGCGRGRALIRLAQAFPNSRFTGLDFGEPPVAVARAAAQAAGLKNIQFRVQDAASWDEPASADWVTALDAIHDQARPDRVLRNIRRALRPAGVFLMQDIDMSSEVAQNMDHPIGPMLYTVSCMHCMTVSLAQGGMGLGTAWGRELAESMLREAGFGKVEIHRFPHDIQNAYFIAT